MTADAAGSVNIDYYEQFAAEYDLFFRDLRASMEKEGSWLDGLLRCRGATAILDASCGSGRQTIPLAERGYRVTGADPSPAMLQRARQMAQQMQLDITLIKAAFTDLPRLLTQQFDAVLALGNGLCHQDRRQDIVESLRAMRQLCCPSGICLVGIKDFDAVRRDRPRFQGHQIRDEGGERTICFEVWDYADPLLISTAYTISGHSKDWCVHSAETREYMLGAEEFIVSAREAGFNTIQRLDHFCEVVYALW